MQFFIAVFVDDSIHLLIVPSHTCCFVWLMLGAPNWTHFTSLDSGLLYWEGHDIHDFCVKV